MAIYFNFSNNNNVLLQRLRDNDSTLTELDLSSWCLNDQDMYNLVDALRRNTYLKKLDVSNNTISDDGARVFLSNRTLLALSLDYFRLSAETQAELHERIATNRKLEKIETFSWGAGGGFFKSSTPSIQRCQKNYPCDVLIRCEK